MFLGLEKCSLKFKILNIKDKFPVLVLGIDLSILQEVWLWACSEHLEDGLFVRASIRTQMEAVALQSSTSLKVYSIAIRLDPPLSCIKSYRRLTET